MACEIRQARYLSEINTAAELRAARQELEIRQWFAAERLAADVEDTFTFDNLLSLVAPPGSVVDRVIGGVGTGFTALQGLLGFVGTLFGGERRHHAAPLRAARRHHAAHKSKGAHIARHKRTPEIEVEVELDE
jgi:hypothetical protein